MAYSRWGESRWFVFGCSGEDVPPEKQELVIQDNGEVGFSAHYFFPDLKANLEGILKDIQATTGAGEGEMYELRKCIVAFNRDVQFGIFRGWDMESVDMYCEKHEFYPMLEVKSCFIKDDGTTIQVDYPDTIPDIEINLWSKAEGCLFFVGNFKEGEDSERYAILGVALKLTPKHYHSKVVHWIFKKAVDVIGAERTLPKYRNDEDKGGL